MPEPWPWELHWQFFGITLNNNNNVYIFFFLFHSIHHWTIAVSTICRHSSRVVAFLQAVARPKFRGPMSASIAWSQVWLGPPIGRFQSGGTCRIAAARARWWSSRDELRAIRLKSRRRLLVTRWESSKQPMYTSVVTNEYLSKSKNQNLVHYLSCQTYGTSSHMLTGLGLGTYRLAFRDEALALRFGPWPHHRYFNNRLW